jgi:hypothetical protein
MSGNGSPVVLALIAVLPACSSGLDFDGLSGDFGKGCATGIGPNCEDVASGLSGLRVELPCKGDGMPAYTCLSDPSSEKMTTLRGTAGTKYDLRLRFRGIVELNTYGQGVSSDFPFQVGGTDSGGAYNTYALTVSDPPQTYFLNAVLGVGDRHAWSDPVDITETVPAKAMATVTLRGEANDAYTIKNIDSNGNPIRSPGGVEPTATPFPGQFMQVDVVSVTIGP